jgi:hypothetical protein
MPAAQKLTKVEALSSDDWFAPVSRNDTVSVRDSFPIASPPSGIPAIPTTLKMLVVENLSSAHRSFRP